MTNLSHQVKSSRYYLFWGICTVAVVLGQIYVGSGYRRMSHSVEGLTMVMMEAMGIRDSNSIVCQEMKCVPLGKVDPGHI